MDARKKKNLINEYRNCLINSVNTEEFPENDDEMDGYLSSSLGDDYFFGTDETARNEKKACFFYENSADNGNAYGQYKAGMLNAVLAMEEGVDVRLFYGI